MNVRRKNEIWEEGEEGDVSSYWTTLRKREDNGNRKRKHKIAQNGDLWQRLRTCRNRDSRMNDYLKYNVLIFFSNYVFCWYFRIPADHPPSSVPLTVYETTRMSILARSPVLLAKVQSVTVLMSRTYDPIKQSHACCMFLFPRRSHSSKYNFYCWIKYSHGY